MSTSESASDTGDRVLVCSPNWVGDCIMAMPAVQALAASAPDVQITVLARESLVPLWRMNPAAVRLLVLRRGVGGTLRAVREVGAAVFDRACVLSHSMRSALIPFAARVPVRCGTPGQRRGWLLNRLVSPDRASDRRHQTFEYMDVMGLEGLPAGRPRLALPGGLPAACRPAEEGPLAALLPGAARGPSKRWPEERFAEVGCRLAAEAGCRILVLGTAGERELCGRVASRAGPDARSLAGETTLPELAALLARCSVVVANDSGGMHLAAAAGARVAAVFGATDPAVTGPLGGGHRIVRARDVGAVSRAVSRRSARARARLESITVDEVFRAAVEAMSASAREG